MIFFRENSDLLNEITLLQPEIEHLKSFRIFHKDKEVEFRDGSGNSFFYYVQESSEKGILRNKKIFQEKEYAIEIATAIPKSERLDFLIQKGTEIGVSRFLFVNFMQSERKDFNLDRSQKIIKEAASQSKRHFLPKIQKYEKLEKLLDSGKKFFYLDPLSEENISEEKIKNRVPIIGPEGGFRKEEIELLSKRGVSGYCIGKNILKIETAFLYIASVIQYISFFSEKDT
ncbi:MAG: 16S rRNA (uracil(1498)-N(3))-methyltransferase [Leptospiraceae bacterium]|nr:16S rRNA (uracil(1498)-N(3))-methyltransferase [Leptospiraceae bacterium]MCK6381252.1 16S rRNA (uracil(1498)-N(3))-methyltransferase [Leptospiraceae bacterium]NUM41404.1 16S rRNA (uracil(1498)-N(3))-methyltransferase [Leptospiraceae bacterium]